MRSARRSGRIPGGTWPALAGVLLLSTAVFAAGKPAPPPPVPPPPASEAIPEPPEPPELPTPPAPEPGDFVIAKGTTHEGDLTKISGSITVAGTQRGSLRAWGGSLVVTGDVTEDVHAVTGSVLVDGHVGGDLRSWSGTTTLNGTVDGDVHVFGGSIRVGPRGHIKGSLEVASQECTVEGTVDQNLIATGGLVHLAGKVGGDAKIETETFTYTREARIAGDLSYTARNVADPRGTHLVGGEIREGGGAVVREHLRHGKKAHALRDERPPFNVIGFVVSALLGPLVILIFRKPLASVAGQVGRETLRSAGVGFILALSPIAAAFTAILLITIPLIVLYWLFFALAAFFAKLPVAIWLGERGIERLGRPSPSPYPAYFAGLVVLYLVFAIPYVGTLVWVIVTLIGLGAMFLGGREYRSARRAARAAGAAPAAPLPPEPPAGEAPMSPATP